MNAPCPHGSGELRVVEVGVMVEELPEPVKWSPQHWYCLKGCLLVAGDLPEGGA